MNILVVIPDSDIGGITTAAVNFCNELCQRGHSVTLLDMSGKYRCDSQLNSAVARGHLTGKSRFWRLGADDLKKARGARRIMFATLGIIKKLTIRSGLWYRLIFKKYKEFGSFDAALAFRQCAPCYSFVLHKVTAKTKIGFVHGELKGMGDIDSWKKHMADFDTIAYVSNAVKEEFVHAYPELYNNAQTIYNMLDVETIQKASQQQCDNVFNNNRINIVTVSRIDNEHKKIDRIAPVCKKLKENGFDNFAWYVVGNGPDLEACVQQANDLSVADVLYFCGAKENPYPYIYQADFTVLPSKSEAFGLVVVESLILGKPVVACEYPALKELLEDDITGIIAKQSEESLYLAVRKMIEESETRSRLLVNCLNYTYSNDVAYQQFWGRIQ